MGGGVILGCSGFTWASSPACTELEMAVTDWLGKMVGLPKEFLFEGGGGDGRRGGGGVIHGTASEASAFAVTCARERLMDRRTEQVHLLNAR